MAKLSLYKIKQSQLASLPISEGQLIVTTDDGKIYLDDAEGRRITLYSDEIEKLSSIARNATKVETSSKNGYIIIDGVEVQVYAKETDANTTYTLSKSGNTITLTGTDGSSTSVTDSNTTYSEMTGSSTSVDGKAGLVPAPVKGNSNRYLSANGTWSVPTNTTYSNATTDAAGLMSKEDKIKLDAIAEGAQVNTVTGVKGNSETTYRTGDINITKANIGLGNVDNKSTSDILSSMTKSHVTTALGFEPPQEDTNTTYGLKLDNGKLSLVESGDTDTITLPEGALYGLSISGNTVSLVEGGTQNSVTIPDNNTTYSLTQDSTDKHKLIFKPSNANAVTLTIPDNDTTYDVASTTASGLMTADMVTKLNSVETGATKNSASSTTPKANGTATVGSETAYARGDHIHPLQTTVSGNAGTATKLKTAVDINGVSFDGSSDITVTANPTTTTLTNEDLNNVKTPGLYNAAGGNTTSNKPSGIDAYGLFVYKTAGGYVTQELTCGNNNAMLRYIRQYNSSTWTDWTQMKYTDTTYTFTNGLSKSGSTVSNSGVRSVGTGTANGTISVNTNGTASDVSVKGLSNAAYKNVDTTISAASTSTNLPTSAAVASFVEGKGYKTTDNNTTYTFATGDSNGQIKVTPSGGSAQNISVKGLGNLAYKSSLTASDVGAISSSLLGAANGVAQLDSSGKVPSAQLPSYVDDTVEGYLYNSKFYKESAHTTQITGETGKIYVDISTNKTYRWSGSAFVEISSSLALGTTSSTAFRGDYGNTAYTHATDSNRLTTATASGLYKVASTANGHIASLTAVTKSDITGLGIPGSDTNTTYTFASGDSNGQIKVTPSSGTAVNVSVKGLGAGAYKAVDTSISAASTSTNIPTSKAVAAFVEGKGYKTTDNNTTYTLTQDSTDGHKITLTPSSGTATTITIPDNNTTYDIATTTTNGLMSSAMLTKLNGIAAGAQVNTITGVKGNSETSYRTGNVNITKANIGLGNVDNTADANKSVKSAVSATKDSASQQINTTYIKSVSVPGRKITLTKGDGTTTSVENFTTTVNTNTANIWVKLGTFNNQTQGEGGEIWLFGGNGQNNATNQNMWAHLFIKKGYQGSTPSTTNYVAATYEIFTPPSCAANYKNVKFKVFCTEVGVVDVWVYFPYTYSRSYYYPAGQYDSFTVANTYQTEEPVAGDTYGVLQPISGGIIASSSNGTSIDNVIKGLSISGKTITYTKGDDTTGTLTTQDTTYTGANGVSISGTTISNSGVRSISTGDNNGTIKVNTNGTSTNVAVKGLSDLAYIAKGTSATTWLNGTGTWTTPTAANVGALASTTKYAASASVGGDASKAVQLTTGRAIDGITFNGTAAISHYGTCSTAAATAAKVVSCTNYTLVTGSRIIVKFTVTNTAAVANLTLNVNSTGAKAIKYRNANLSSAGVLAANRVYEFIYDGTNYQIVGDLDTNTNTTYTADDTTLALNDKTFSMKSGIVTAGSAGPTAAVTGNNDATIDVPRITVDTYGRVTALSSYKLTCKNTNTNYYPTTWTWTAGTTNGPTASITGSGMSAVSVGAIPAANGTTASGIVTTGAQTFGGVKTFSSAPKLSTNTLTTSGGYTVTIPNATSTLATTSTTQSLTNKTYNGYTLAAACAKGVDTSLTTTSTSTNLPTSKAVAELVSSAVTSASGCTTQSTSLTCTLPDNL